MREVQETVNETLWQFSRWFMETAIFQLLSKLQGPHCHLHNLVSQVTPLYNYLLTGTTPPPSRLPVRNMLFQCSICRHGGHQSCYRQFYLNQPMVDLPPAYTAAEDESRGRSSTRTDSTLHEFVNRSESTVGAHDYHQTPVGSGGGGGGLLMGAMMVGGELVGHPCAAGCGHFCWAALRQV